MSYNRAEQALAFDPVLPWPGQIQPLSVGPEGKVSFRLAAPEAGSVSLTIMEEEYPCVRNGQGIWEMELPIGSGMHYVQLKIDGTEVLTPLLPIGYGYSRPYNYVELEEEDFYRMKTVPHGSVRREYFFSKVTGEWDSCMVYTPAVYDEQLEKIFPVLYLQHGHGENEMSWITAGKVHFILDNLIAEKKAVPFVVVMCNGMVQIVDENGKRIVDFKRLEHLLLEDVIPFIQQKFRVGRTKEMRAMAGLSMGSLQTSITGFSHPEYFSALGIFSGFVSDIMQGTELDMVQRGPGQNEHLRMLEDGDTFAEAFPVYFRAIGNKDPFWKFFKQDDELLKAKNISQIRKIYKGAHDWNVWRQCIRDFAQLIFKTGY